MSDCGYKGSQGPGLQEATDGNELANSILYKLWYVLLPANWQTASFNNVIELLLTESESFLQFGSESVSARYLYVSGT